MKSKSKHVGKVYKLIRESSLIFFDDDHEDSFYILKNTLILVLGNQKRVNNSGYIKILVLSGKHEGKIGEEISTYFEGNQYEEVKP